MARVRNHHDSVDYVYNSATIQTETIHAINEGHVRDLLVEATKSAIRSAYEFNLDMPVGAATGRHGHTLASDYAKDNLLGNPAAHAEYMAIERTHKRHPHTQPDSIGVTLEPCSSCQEFLSTIPSLRLAAYVLPTSEASRRGLVRRKAETILHRQERGELPYDVVLMHDPQLQKIGRILLDYTRRNIETRETSVDILRLDRALPKEFRP